MKCPRCEADNRDGRRFCGACGLALAWRCPSCEFSNDAGERFCGGCGAPLAPGSATAASTPRAPQQYTPSHLADRILTSRSALEGERKQVTVLFADLKGSMELLADRDPEDARKILDPVLERMMDAVHRYEGTVNQVMGDGIMALFGAPIAHEDHAVRACYAAVAMQELIKSYGERVRREQGVVPQIRVGLNSGEVVVRSIGSDLRMDYTAVGQTTHLAARVEQAATPGSILITAATLQHAEGYVEVAPLGPVRMKGVADPVDVYEVTGVSAVRSRLQALARRGLTRFVGRAGELGQLDAALQHARAGRGQVVAVVGEPGVGKSRLVREFTHSHRTKGCLLLETGSVSYGRTTSWLAVVDLLRTYFQIDARDDRRKIREKVTGKVLSLDRTLEPSLPALLSLLDVPVDDERWTSAEPDDVRQETLDGLRALLVRESLVQPVVLVFEDLHWIDPESQAALDRLVDGVPAAHVLLLLTYRPEYQHGWSGKSYYAQLRVDPLASASAHELLHALLGGDDELAELHRVLIARTDGNPFFLEESVRTLVETKALVGEPGAYRLAGPIHAMQVPASVQAVLAARIDRLPVGEKRLLQAAAVVGDDVPLPLLREVVEEDDADLPRALARLQAAEFLHETTVFPEVVYTFTHALTHEVAYGSVLQERRRALHARIVEVIERLAGDHRGEHVERLAYHAFRGEVWGKALEYLWRAGMRAALRSAHREALSCFEQAFAALAHLPETRETTICAIDLRLDSRVFLAPLRQYDRILDHMREAEVLARAVGDRRRLGLVLADMGARLRNVGEHERALDASRQALDIAAELGDRDLEIEAQYRLAQAHFAVGDLERAAAMLTANVKALSAHGPALRSRYAERSRAALPIFFEAWPRSWLALSLAHLGRFTDALEHAEEAVRIAERTKHQHTTIESYAALGGVHLERGDLAAARRLFERGIAMLHAQETSDANLACGLAYASALSGHVADAVPVLEESARNEASISAMGLGLAVRMTRLAEGYLLAGRDGDALERAQCAIDLARKHGERANEAAGLRVLGEVLAHRGDAIGAADRFAESLALAETLGMRPLAAHCHLGLATLDRRTGEPRDHLVTAIDLYREMEMTSWLAKAQSLV